MAAPDFTSPKKREAILRKFAEYLCARRGLADNTINNYKAAIRRITRDIGLRPTHARIDRYIVQLRKSGISYSYLVSTSVALERYMEFLRDPIELGRPRKPKSLVLNTLSEAEVTLMIAACKTLRQRTMLALLACSGIRNNEFCQLRIRDVDIANQELHIRRGKGQKDRKANIVPACVGLLLHYLEERQGSAEDFLFVTASRKLPYEAQDLRKFVHVVAKRAGIRKRVYPHLLRHSLATNMLARGSGLFAIKEQLGHAFVQTTIGYLHSSSQRMQREYQMYAPSYL